MPEKTNLYEILGVSKSASIDEIKSKYRDLVLRFHPDKNNSKNSEIIFKEISKAYEILSDPIKRSSYDQQNFDSKKESKPEQNESAREIWFKQLKAIGIELFRLLQKYAQSMNEKQKTSTYSYTDFKKYEDPWSKSWNDDLGMINEMFGFLKLNKKGKRKRN